MELLWLRLARLLVLALCCASIGRVRAQNEDPVEPVNFPTNGLGSWIWTYETHDRQTCLLWKAFDIPPGPAVTKARLRMTVDNAFSFYLDGRELGKGAEWRHLCEFDFPQLLPPGRHILAVQGFNSTSFAGMILGLHIELSDGQVIEIYSDTTWRIAPEGSVGWERRTEAPPSWPAASIVGALGSQPWWMKPESIDVVPPLAPLKVFFWQQGWFQLTLLSVSVLVVAISLRLTALLALHRKERWLLERERARIARDIHDDIGSRMTQLVLHGEVAQSELPENSEMRVQLDRMCEDAREVLNSMDEILWAVNPRRDTLRDFVSYVCAYAEEFLKSTSIKCLLQVDLDMSSGVLDLPFRRSLLMVVKETLNNAVKHSGATELLLQIDREGQELIVIVQDNGKGFDQATMKEGRNGMANMAGRLSELGGRCRVISHPGKGCRIELNVPLAHSRKPLRFWTWNSSGQPKKQKPSHQTAASPPHDAIQH